MNPSEGASVFAPGYTMPANPVIRGSIRSENSGQATCSLQIDNRPKRITAILDRLAAINIRFITGREGTPRPQTSFADCGLQKSHHRMHAGEFAELYCRQEPDCRRFSFEPSRDCFPVSRHPPFLRSRISPTQRVLFYDSATNSSCSTRRE